MDGPDRFIADLEALGMTVERRGALVVVTLDVDHPDVPGPHQVATDPPKDYPNVPPHWLHMHRSFVLTDGQSKTSDLSEEWRKWSRAHPKWRGGDSGGQQWVAHARSLFLSAKIA